ncbi:cuticle protein 7-like [Vanessa cardui]|uniref:cuticle protein 7-like n=1 Tax=Vanessa cardui TaxID=171605 RepID=UPI001F14953A|nr:cuticle protein 7-like [Vanessa cardui]
MNSFLVVSCLFAFSAVAVANPPALLSYAEVGSIPNSNYEFNYAVNDPSTGDNKAQWEKREGDVVRGAYSLVEPDGNVRIVEYTADAVRGFNAVVKRTGPNVHSVSAISKPIVEHVAPIQHAPVANYEPLEDLAPIDHSAYGPIDDYGHEQIGHEQIGHEQIGHEQYGHIDNYGPLADIAPIATPIVESEPIIAPIKNYDYYPLPSAPWVSLSGSSYGSKGNIVRRWAAGPISLDGKTLTIKTKH